MADERSSSTSRPSRDRILEMLRLRARTVEELAQAIGVTANAIRAQLTALERDGLVRREEIRHRVGAGKPPWLFGLTAAAEAEYSRAYVPALTALAETLSGELGAGALRRLFARVGQRLAASVPDPGDATAVQFAGRILESLGASVKIDAGSTPAMVEGVACPLAATVSRCPDSCEIVRSLLADATGANVETRCAHDGVSRCRFAVG